MPDIRHTLAIGLTAVGLAACGGGGSSSSSPPAAEPGSSGVDAPARQSNGVCTLPTSAKATDTSWNTETGAHAPDGVDTGNYLPLSIALDTLAVSSSSPCLTVTRNSDSLTTISVDGKPAITLTRDTHGLTIRSTLAGNTHVAYQLSGSGKIPLTLYSDNDYKLVLSSARLESPDGPALNLQSEKTAFVELRGNSTLTDSTTWSKRTADDGDEMDLKATLFAEGPLVIDGSGSLGVTARGRHALASDRHLRLRTGSLTLSAETRDGLRANDAFIMDGGILRITTPAGKGIKVEGKERTPQALGFIAINGGQLTVRSHDKAITASWESEEDGETATLEDDPDPRVTINGGTLDITTTGPVRNDSDDPPDVDAPSPEGIEAKSLIRITGGDIRINSQDDSLNAGTGLEISGGRIHAHSVLNDSLDSNGTMTISGGLMVATSQGPNPEGALDSDSSAFTITGGTFVGLGYYNSTPSADSTQNIVTVTNGLNNSVAPGLWSLRDATGKVAFAFEVPFAASYMTLSSPAIADGAAYTVVTGGTLGPVKENFHGLAVEPTTHTGDTAGTSFTVQQRLSCS